MIKQPFYLAALGLLVACGPPELDPVDAQVAWDTTQRTLHGGSSSGEVDVSGGFGGGKFTQTCDEGGKVVFSYDLGDFLGDAISGESFGFTWDVGFRGCQVDGIKVKGNMEFGMLTDFDETQFSAKWWYQGRLVYRGEVTGSCRIDMNGLVAADSTSARVEYEGSFCGNDASLVLTADADGVDFEAEG